MQTFLPYENFVQTAQVLDRKRLGKQRAECKQIFNAMYRGGGWKNHPAVRMWRGHGATLYKYYEAICAEWVHRGYKHDMRIDFDIVCKAKTELTIPTWLGDPSLHHSHRVVLLRKNPEHYKQHFTELVFTDHYTVLWPVDKAGKNTLALQIEALPTFQRV